MMTANLLGMLRIIGILQSRMANGRRTADVREQ